jgi:regulator of protease activity HflC (stomatin/prohibitin superfamily)
MNMHTLSLDGARPATRSSKWRRFIDRHLPTVVIYLMVLTLIGIVLFPHVVVTVSSGHVGVLWERFGGGTVLDPRQLKDEGLHLIWPWNELFIYDVRLQSITETYDALSSDGVSLTASVNARFRLQRNTLGVLHKAIGPDYLRLIAQPGIGSLTREVIAQYTAEQVYSTARQEIQDKIRQRTLEKAGEKRMGALALSDMFVLYDTLLYGIELPPFVVNAINRKTEQYYISEEFRFRIERERRESERKKIEAEGIRDFQQTVSQGISDSYLRWRGIDATLQLSQSTNSKVVIIGNAKDGLPIILGNMDGAQQAAGTPPAGHEKTGTDVPTTAAGPATPLEKTAPSSLTAPPEKVPPARSDASSATAPGETGSAWPPSLQKIESFFDWMIRPGDSRPDAKPGAATTDTATKPVDARRQAK